MHTLPKAITFDCYGTLIDWEGEIQRFFAQVLASKHIQGVDTRALQRHWEEVQFAFIEQYHPYRQVLRETMPQAFADFGLPSTEEDAEAFASSMGHWQPFPDTQTSLQALQALGIKVVLITNTDDEIIAQTQPRLGRVIQAPSPGVPSGAPTPGIGHQRHLACRLWLQVRRHPGHRIRLYHRLDQSAGRSTSI